MIITIIVHKSKGNLNCTSLFFLEIDKCTMQGHRCNVNALCVKNGGVYKCICKDGFHGDGNTCTGRYRKFYVFTFIGLLLQPHWFYAARLPCNFFLLYSRLRITRTFRANRKFRAFGSSSYWGQNYIEKHLKRNENYLLFVLGSS